MKDLMDIKIGVIKALNKAFKMAEKETNNTIEVIEIDVKQIAAIITEYKLCKESNIKQDNLNMDIGRSLNDLGFSNTGTYRIIMKSYLEQVTEESNTKV